MGVLVSLFDYFFSCLRFCRLGDTPPPQISRSTPQASEQRKKRRNINERHISETSHSLRPPLNFSSSFLSRSKKFNLPYTVVMGDPLFWVVTRGETLRDDSTLCLLLKIIFSRNFLVLKIKNVNCGSTYWMGRGVSLYSCPVRLNFGPFQFLFWTVFPLFTLLNGSGPPSWFVIGAQGVPKITMR